MKMKNKPSKKYNSVMSLFFTSYTSYKKDSYHLICGEKIDNSLIINSSN
jgi:hypothetical protein